MSNIYSFITAALVAVSLPVVAQNVHVHGTVSGIDDGKRVLLMLSDGRTAISVASDTIRNGAFSLKATVTVDDGLSLGELMFMDESIPPITMREFYIAPGTDIEATISELKELKSYPVKSNIPQQAEFDRYIDKSRKQLEDMVELFLSGKPRMELNEPLDSISAIIDANDIGLLYESPVDEVWIYKLTDLAQSASYAEDGNYMYLDELKNLYDRIPEYLRDDTRIERIKAFLYPPVTVGIGDDYADAGFFDLDGNSHSLSEFAGKWIFLDFWSRGCYACILAIPELDAFAKAHPDDVAVVSISSDETGSWKGASKTHNITWHNWSDGKMDAGIYAVYGCDALPTFVIISPEGKIVDRWEGFGAGMFEQKLREHNKGEK